MITTPQMQHALDCRRSDGLGLGIVTEGGGMGLDGLLRGRGSRLVGIVNGIDTTVWDPTGDPAIAAPYSARNLKPRVHDKRALEGEFGLKGDFTLDFDIQTVSDDAYFNVYDYGPSERLESALTLTRARRDDFLQADLTYHNLFEISIFTHFVTVCRWC